MALLDRWPLKRGSIHLKYSMTGQDKDDLLIQVTAWAGLTVHVCHFYIWLQQIKFPLTFCINNHSDIII
jgi:hypothetical protein